MTIYSTRKLSFCHGTVYVVNEDNEKKTNKQLIWLIFLRKTKSWLQTFQNQLLCSTLKI